MEPEFSSTGRLLQMCAKKHQLSYGNDEMAQNPVPLVNTKNMIYTVWQVDVNLLVDPFYIVKIAIALHLNQGKLGWSHHFRRFITRPLLLEGEQPAVALSGGRQRVRSKQSGSFFRRFRSSYGRGALRYLASTDKQRIDRDGQGVECFGLV